MLSASATKCKSSSFVYRFYHSGELSTLASILIPGGVALPRLQVNMARLPWDPTKQSLVLLFDAKCTRALLPPFVLVLRFRFQPQRQWQFQQRCTTPLQASLASSRICPDLSLDHRRSSLNRSSDMFAIILDIDYGSKSRLPQEWIQISCLLAIWVDSRDQF
jgi:hypothetical protein